MGQILNIKGVAGRKGREARGGGCKGRGEEGFVVFDCLGSKSSKTIPGQAVKRHRVKAILFAKSNTYLELEK